MLSKFQIKNMTFFRSYFNAILRIPKGGILEFISGLQFGYHFGSNLRPYGRINGGVRGGGAPPVNYCPRKRATFVLLFCFVCLCFCLFVFLICFCVCFYYILLCCKTQQTTTKTKQQNKCCPLSRAIIHRGGSAPPDTPIYSAVGPQIGSEMVSKLKTRYELRIPPLGFSK